MPAKRTKGKFTISEEAKNTRPRKQRATPKRSSSRPRRTPSTRSKTTEDKTTVRNETAKVSKREAILARDKYERQSIAAGPGQPTEQEIRDQRLQALDSIQEQPELQDPSTLISKLQETVREIVVSWCDSIEGRRPARARWDLVYNRFAWLKDDLLCFLRTRRPGIETRELAADLESFAALATWHPKVEPDAQLLQRTWNKIRILERHIRSLKKGEKKEKARAALLKRMDEIDNLSAKASSDITLQLKEHAPHLHVLSQQVMRRLVLLQHELCGRKAETESTPESKTMETESPPDSPTETTPAEPPGDFRDLRVDKDSVKVYWRDQALAINSHSDFKILAHLIRARDRMVPYLELSRVVKPDARSDRIEILDSAPNDVTNSLRRIRAALRQVEAPFTYETIRGEGIRRAMPDVGTVGS